MPLTEPQIAAIEANLFPATRAIVRKRADFPWHRDGSGNITGVRQQSSQALAIDIFGTVRALSSRDRIVDSWMDELGIRFKAPWSIELESELPRELLGERRPTQIDVLAEGKRGVVLYECKFTEKDGGSCSQTEPLRAGEHRGVRQCNGDYVQQVNPVSCARSRCALTGKNIRYWEVIPDVLAIDPAQDHRPCPFAGGWYQWMRNLVAARALGQLCNVPAAFVVVYADGAFPMSERLRSDEWTRFQALTNSKAVPLRAVSYQRLVELARASASGDDRRTLDDLSAWLDRKLGVAASSFRH